MSELPLVQKLQAMALREGILEFLEGGFGVVPRDVRSLLTEVKSPKQLTKLIAGLWRHERIEDFQHALIGCLSRARTPTRSRGANEANGNAPAGAVPADAPHILDQGRRKPCE